MNSISLPAAFQSSPSKVVVEIPTLGLKATIHFKPLAKAASERPRRSNGQFVSGIDPRIHLEEPAHHG